MTTLPIPLNQGLNRSVDDLGVRGYNSRFYDIFIDSSGNINRRPGLYPDIDLSESAGVDGLMYWEAQEKFVAICNGYFFIEVAGVLTKTGSQLFEVGEKVYWAEYGAYLYAANGGKIIQLHGVDLPAALTDGDAPITVKAIDIIDTYLVALETGTEKIWYADAGDPTSWSGVFVSATYRPDVAKMIGVRNNILEVFGSETIEGIRTTGNASSPFISDDAYTVELGIDSPDSATFISSVNTWYWLSNNKQIVKMVGRQPVPIDPEGLGTYIESFHAATSNSVSGECFVNGIPHYILTFPTANKTIAVNTFSDRWYEFGYWNTGTSSHDRWRGFCYARYPVNGYQYVGDYANGKIYKMNPVIYQDNSSTLCSLVQTEIIDRGSMGERKFPKRLVVWNKRVSGSSSTASIKWRDHGNASWKTARTLSLGQTGDSDILQYINNPGSYLSRQYEISVTANSPFCLVKIDEEF